MQLFCTVLFRNCQAYIICQYFYIFLNKSYQCIVSTKFFHSRITPTNFVILTIIINGRFAGISIFLDRRQSGPIKSVLVIIGWLVGWLVGNAVFSETALRIFLIFCMKLVDYKGRKVTAGFCKKNLDLEIFVKRSPN